MSVRLPDDPARHFREVWVGAPGVGVWPVAARFVMWGLAFGLWPVSFLALAFVIPAITMPVLVILAALRYVKQHEPKQLKLARVASIGMLVLLVSFKLDAAFWLLPMHWALAAVLAPAMAVLLTSRIAPYVDLNVPLGYRARLLFAVARRPRRLRGVEDIAVTEHIVVVSDGVDLDDFRPKLSLVKEK